MHHLLFGKHVCRTRLRVLLLLLLLLLLAGELDFVVHELAHENKIGRDDGSLVAHHVVGVVHAHLHLVHQVGDDNGGRARYARLTVHQHFGLVLNSSVCLFLFDVVV